MNVFLRERIYIKIDSRGADTVYICDCIDPSDTVDSESQYDTLCKSLFSS